MNCIYIGVIFLLSVFLTSIIIPRILFISYKKRLFDIRDERKVHKIPVPRLGGLSFSCHFSVSLYSYSYLA